MNVPDAEALVVAAAGLAANDHGNAAVGGMVGPYT